MELNLQNLETRVSGVVQEIVGGEKSWKLWGAMQRLLRKEQQKLTGEINVDLQNLAETMYRDMFQILGEDVEDVSEADTIAKKIAQDTIYEIRDMFTEAGVVNKNGFYSTFERHASDLEKAIDKAADSDDYELEMDEYVKKTIDAGVVYKDASGRAKR